MKGIVRTDIQRLGDILASIEQIESFVAVGREEIARSPVLQAAILHHLQILGEAMSRVSAVLQENHPVVRWKSYIDLRNEIVHDYFDMSLSRTWIIIENDLPTLKEQIMSIINV